MENGRESYGLDHLKFGHLILFRISDFVLRIFSGVTCNGLARNLRPGPKDQVFNAVQMEVE